MRQNDNLGLAGRRALVTGGTEGIGRAVVGEAVAAIRSEGVIATGGALDVADGPALKTWVAGTCRRSRCLVTYARRLLREAEQDPRLGEHRRQGIDAFFHD